MGVPHGPMEIACLLFPFGDDCLSVVSSTTVSTTYSSASLPLILYELVNFACSHYTGLKWDVNGKELKKLVIFDENVLISAIFLNL